MNDMIKNFIEQSGLHLNIATIKDQENLKKFTNLVVNQCIDSIETYRIPVGNSAAGELACEWTYDALKDIRDEIKEKFDLK